MLLKLGYGSSTYPMYVGFSTLYRVDAIEAPARQSSAAPAAARFSTLYRVDAIEAGRRRRFCRDWRGFSTLYRVDAIEARLMPAPCPRRRAVSVPSIGSMLLKLSGRRGGRLKGLVSVPSIGSMLLKLTKPARHHSRNSRFSTLYRVDAIEAQLSDAFALSESVVSVPSIGSMLLKRRRRRSSLATPSVFQYPLSGRCY